MNLARSGILDNCSTIGLSAFCSPCMYGQMGAHKKKMENVHVVWNY